MLNRCLLILTAGIIVPAAQASLVATYVFNNDLNAQQPGVAPLVAVDPLGTSGFENLTVFGNSRNTYHFDGGVSPADQGGLQLDTTGLIGTNNYSVEMVFKLDDGNGAFRRVLDSQNRGSDNGLYIDPTNHIAVYPEPGVGDPFTPSTFFDVFITVDATDNVAGYFGGIQQFSINSPNMDITSNFLNFFLDNTSGLGIGEWSKGNIALIKVFDTALSASEVRAETEDPFLGTSTPEPSGWILMLSGAAGLAAGKFRIRR